MDGAARVRHGGAGPTYALVGAPSREVHESAQVAHAARPRPPPRVLAMTVTENTSPPTLLPWTTFDSTAPGPGRARFRRAKRKSAEPQRRLQLVQLGRLAGCEGRACFPHFAG